MSPNNSDAFKFKDAKAVIDQISDDIHYGAKALARETPTGNPTVGAALGLTPYAKLSTAPKRRMARTGFKRCRDPALRRTVAGLPTPSTIEPFERPPDGGTPRHGFAPQALGSWRAPAGPLGFNPTKARDAPIEAGQVRFRSRTWPRCRSWRPCRFPFGPPPLRNQACVSRPARGGCSLFPAGFQRGGRLARRVMLRLGLLRNASIASKGSPMSGLPASLRAILGSSRS